ncbi:HAMP domain-containing sensor histidine kinase [Rathayibacter tritici]|uniref:histidine kinase n=1 Tax=Rathayibacter tritici TaxID=33888 RepID=A0A160KVR1_9MICO|nr:HAMP domain-containing sensor histidine kinase [Rathayibacter tritici]AND17853.1 hypothetical protein A6122_2743 [Rathayibacter tritici]PPI47164.1 sensor histidine kinase [Rathayibacter tritici]
MTGVRSGSLRRRLAAVVAGAVALAVVLVAALTWLVVSDQLRGSLDTALDREAIRVQRLLVSDPEWTGGQGSTCRYVIEPACVRRVDRMSAAADGPLRTSAQVLAVIDGTSPRERYTSEGVRVLVLPVGDGGAVMVGLPTRQTDTALERTALALAVTGSAGVLLAAAFGAAAATAALRPVRRLDDAVRRVRAEADPHAPLDLGPDSARNDELGRLSRSFTAMLAELAIAQDAQRDFVADASHELRTPLTTLRTNIQLLTGANILDDATQATLRTALVEELDAMALTIDDLVELARGDRARPPALTAVEVVGAARAAATAAQRRWPSPVTVETAVEGVQALVPDGRLTRLLDVVLDNAGKYGAGRPVRIKVDLDDARRVVINVVDQGVGIPRAERERVFERFRRGAASRGTPGSGLGLAIAAQIVADSGGRITAEDSPGGGTTIRIVLPVA